MRTAWIPGAAGETPLRYITPWREDEDVLTPDLEGNDHPERYPFDPMDGQAFVASTWRTRIYEFEWAVSMTSLASGFAFTRSGQSSAVCTALFPAVGQDPELAQNEEWRIGAGYRQLFQQTTTGIPGYDAATVTVECLVGGRHQYIEGNAVTPQRFRPEVSWQVALSLNDDPGAAEDAAWGLLANRSEGTSVGVSSMSLDYYDADDGTMKFYQSNQRTVFSGSGTTVIIAPFSAAATCSIRAVEFWPYADPNGDNPIWGINSGQLLVSPFVAASRAISGRPIVNTALLGGVRFVA